jgi:hypothetical protein
MNRSWILTLGIAALGAALCWSDGAVARLAANGTSLNGVNLNGSNLNSMTPNAVTLRGVRLVLPDGTELLFR